MKQTPTTPGKLVAFIRHVVIMLFICMASSVSTNAAVTITKASGGTNIAADKAANGTSPAFTTLGNLVLTENLVTDFSVGTNVTFTMSAATGWTFNPSASVTATAAPGADISAISVTSVGVSLITIQLSVSGNTNLDVLTVSGLQIRASDGGNVPGTANVTKGGTSAISGCSSGVSLVSLSQVAGAVNKLVVSFTGQTFSDALTFATSGNTGTATAVTAGTSFTIAKIRACDQFFNVVTTYSGVKTLSYFGPSNGVSAPTYTTSVSFASGLSSTSLTTNLKKAQTTTITVSDGTTSGPVSSSILVNPGAVANFLVEDVNGGNIVSQVTGIPFDIKLTARDANNNLCTTGANAFTGTAVVSSTGSMSLGGGATTQFTAGVLSPQTVEISNAGNFTITCTKTAGVQAGTSNTFLVNYPPSALTNISPTCVTPGDPDFTIIVDGSNFDITSVVEFNGIDLPTTFIGPNQLSADVSAAFISLAGTWLIAVNTPSTGTTAPMHLNFNSSSIDNATICQGFTYTMPDGTQEGNPGTYVTILPNATGCDSVITTNLSVIQSPTRLEDIYLCPGDSYTLPDGTVESNPGTYISIVPNSGCDSIITTNIYPNTPPFVVATPVQIDCFGNTGSVSLFAVGGMPPYTFGGDPVTNLSAGTYNYSVIDASGCTDMTSATVDPEPDQLTLTATPTQIVCSGGTADVTLDAQGGVPGYSYNSTPTTTLTSGTYNYSVTDNNGCITNAVAIINVPPAAITGTMTIVKTPCGSSTGSATVTASGGVPPFTYAWDTNPIRTTRSITGMPIGTYTVTITDQNGCTGTSTAIVTNLNAATFNITGVTGVCPGASTTLNAKAGYVSYAWSTGETTQAISVNTVGAFTVTATDINGCQAIATTTTHTGVVPTCNILGGELCPNSSLTLRATSGMSSYVWSNGGRNSTNIVRSAGPYSVTIKNSDGCASTCSYTVNNPMRITVTKVDGRCANEFVGNASVTATAGVPPYTYMWGTGNTTTAISDLNAGNYSIRVTDAGGCYSLFTTTINSYKTTGDYSTLGTNFNTTPVNPGSYIWFSAVANVTYSGTYPVTIRFINQNISSARFNLNIPSSKLVITNAVSQASTVFTNGEWVTTAPPNLSGNYFISGYAYSSALGIPASLNPVKWKGIWSASSSCVSNIQWKWSAAVYTGFTVDHTLINVKPCDDNSASPYVNSNPAGTPENYTGNCVAGATGLGGSSFTGNYSTSINRVPCSTLDVCPQRLSDNEDAIVQEKSDFIFAAYPNPFDSRTYIEFERKNNSGHLTIDVYTFYGQKIKTIFDADIEAGEKYRTEFEAGDLVDGVYVYWLIADDERVSGKLILNRK